MLYRPNHSIIGKNYLIGANALATKGKTISDNSLVIGSPGKVVRILTEQEIAVMHNNTAHHVEQMAHDAEGLIPFSINNTIS